MYSVPPKPYNRAMVQDGAVPLMVYFSSSCLCLPGHYKEMSLCNTRRRCG